MVLLMIPDYFRALDPGSVVSNPAKRIAPELSHLSVDPCAGCLFTCVPVLGVIVTSSESCPLCDVIFEANMQVYEDISSYLRFSEHSSSKDDHARAPLRLF